MPEQRDPNRPGPNDRHKLPFTPYLYIRAFPEDQGGRALGGSVVFWNSPDIDFYPKYYGNPMENTAITVQANIWNGGYLPAVGVRVEFFWFTPATILNPTENNRINKQRLLVTVPAQSYLPVTCPVPWIPTFIGDGHECLLVQCHSFLEGKDGLNFPRHPELDRHVGLRNLTVARAPTGQRLQLALHNPFGTEVRFSIFLASRLVRGNFAGMREQDPDALMRFVANATPGGPRNLVERELQLTVEDTSNQDLGVRMVETRPMPSQKRGVLDMQHYLQSRGSGESHALGRRLGEVNLGEGGNATLFLDAPGRDLEPEAYRVLHFSQVTGNCVIGGYTVVMRN